MDIIKIYTETMLEITIMHSALKKIKKERMLLKR